MGGHYSSIIVQKGPTVCVKYVSESKSETERGSSRLHWSGHIAETVFRKI